MCPGFSRWQQPEVIPPGPDPVRHISLLLTAQKATLPSPPGQSVRKCEAPHHMPGSHYSGGICPEQRDRSRQNLASRTRKTSSAVCQSSSVSIS